MELKSDIIENIDSQVMKASSMFKVQSSKIQGRILIVVGIKLKIQCNYES